MSLNERAAALLAEQLADPNEPTDEHLFAAKAQIATWRRQNPAASALLAALDEKVPAQQRQAAPKAPKQAPQEPVAEKPAPQEPVAAAAADEQAGK
jgi:hypothetical protein